MEFIQKKLSNKHTFNFGDEKLNYSYEDKSGSGGFDVPAQRTTASVIRRLGKNGAFIITKAQARGQEAKETRLILSGLGFGSPEQQTTNLKVYKDAAICSLSVLEYDPKSKAAEEIKVLFKWLEKKIAINPLLIDLEKGVSENG